MDNFIYESPPQLYGKCKILSFTIAFFLMLSPIFAFLYVWFEQNFWLGSGVGLLVFLISGIISSKLRVMSIPPDQLEISHSSLEIANWFVAKNICFIARNPKLTEK